MWSLATLAKTTPFKVVATAAGLTVAGGAVIAVASTPSTELTSPPNFSLPPVVQLSNCPKYYLYSVHGSYDSANDLGGTQFFQELQQDLPDTVEPKEDIYPGTIAPIWNHDGQLVHRNESIYWESVAQGSRTLIADVDSLRSRCGDSRKTKLVFFGYSQGADVIRQAYAHFPIWSVVDTVLFGDPHFCGSAPRDTSEGSWRREQHGDYDSSRNGIFGCDPQKPFSSIFSYCSFNDIVCNPGNNVDAHLGYGWRPISGRDKRSWNA